MAARFHPQLVHEPFGDPGLYEGPDAQSKVDALNAERTRLQDEVATLYARWEELDAAG